MCFTGIAGNLSNTFLQRFIYIMLLMLVSFHALLIFVAILWTATVGCFNLFSPTAAMVDRAEKLWRDDRAQGIQRNCTNEDILNLAYEMKNMAWSMSVKPVWRFCWVNFPFWWSNPPKHGFGRVLGYILIHTLYKHRMCIEPGNPAHPFVLIIWQPFRFHFSRGTLQN